MVKTWHVWDFPDDIYILLNKKYTKCIFKEPLYKIAKRLNVNRSTVLGWYRRSWKNQVQYMPLWALKKLISFYKIDKNVTEKQIIAYRVPKGNPILNPKFPIRENRKIFRIIGHLFADGYGGDPKGCTPSYCNTSIESRKEFINLLIDCFGNVPYNNLPKHHTTTFPKAIVKILKKSYKINDFRSSRSIFPNHLLNKGSGLLIGIIKSFIIDESSIREAGIDIYCSNNQLLNSLREICLKLNYKVTPIKQGSGVLLIKIYPSSFIKLKKDIGRLPHKEKEKRLNFCIRILNRKWKQQGRKITRNQIITLLKEKPRTSYEISYKLGISSKSIRDFHLLKMEKEEVVYRDTSSKEHTWYLKSSY